MTDTEILQEIEKRLKEELAEPGWFEEGPGFHAVLNMIKDFRDFQQQWFFLNRDKS